MLHIECTPVRGVYIHGHMYSHRAAVIEGSDCIESIDIDVKKICADSNYLFVQIVDMQGKRAWAPPFWLK